MTKEPRKTQIFYPGFDVMSNAPHEIRPWRECPFRVGARYIVRSDFRSLRDSFTAGEVLSFRYDAWSRYDGMTGYFFEQPDVTRLRVWDISDDDDLEIWKELFEEMKTID